MAWCAIAVTLASATAWELRRVEDRNLFRFRLPWDEPPTPHELLDAELSAQQYFLPAILSVLVLCGLTGIAGHDRSLRSLRLQWPFVGVFVAAAIADLTTTLMFFHSDGVDRELHPAIRLFGYAYGRTVGPVAAKTFQAVAVVFIAGLSKRFGVLLLLVTTGIYTIAAVYNLTTRP